MSFDAIVYQVLIASPGDLEITRAAVAEEIYGWNNQNSEAMNVVLLPRRWETDATPEQGDRGQAVLNRQLVEPADILVDIFFTKVGSPTGEAESGTIEEIRQFVDSGRPTLVYFSSAPLPSDVDLQQVQRVRELKTEMRGRGLLGDFATDDELRRNLSRHIMSIVRQFPQSRASEATTEASEPQTASVATSQLLREVASSPIEQLDVQLSRLDDLGRRFAIDWATERASEPHTIDGGRMILGRLRDQLGTFRADPEIHSRPFLARPLDTALVGIAKLEHHRLYIDGGHSYNEFWTRGQDILDRITAAMRALQGAVELGQDPNDPRSHEFLRSKKACLRLDLGPGRGFPYKVLGGDSVTISVPIRNEGDHVAYDVSLTVTEKDQIISKSSLARLEPQDAQHLQFPMLNPPPVDPPENVDRWYHLRISYRDGLGVDAAVFWVHFTGALSAGLNGEVDTERTVMSPYCGK